MLLSPTSGKSTWLQAKSPGANDTTQYFACGSINNSENQKAAKMVVSCLKYKFPVGKVSYFSHFLLRSHNDISSFCTFRSPPKYLSNVFGMQADISAYLAWYTWGWGDWTKKTCTGLLLSSSWCTTLSRSLMFGIPAFACNFRIFWNSSKTVRKICFVLHTSQLVRTRWQGKKAITILGCVQFLQQVLVKKDIIATKWENRLNPPGFGTCSCIMAELKNKSTLAMEVCSNLRSNGENLRFCCKNLGH